MRSSGTVLNLLLGAAITALPVIAVGQSTPQAAGQYGAATQSSMNSSGKKLDQQDQHFVDKAAEGGLAEVELGHLAEQKATSPAVKQFAERMVNDHSKANDELKQIASEQGFQLPQHLSQKEMMTKQRLEKLSGESFNKAYMQDQLKDHQKDVAAFQQECKTAKDPAIRNFAKQTTPILESHLREAERVAPQVQAKAGAGPMTK